MNPCLNSVVHMTCTIRMIYLSCWLDEENWRFKNDSELDCRVQNQIRAFSLNFVGFFPKADF